jgi:hypothetical protein
MRNLIFIVILVSAFNLSAAGMSNGPLKLMDGSHLFISDDNMMRMVDKDGKPITMKDGVEMELEDGSLIMMKNEKIWRHNHRKHKKGMMKK